MASLRIDEHIMLRTYQLEDATMLFGQVEANRAHLRPWFDWVDTTLKEEHSRQYIQQTLVQMQYQESIHMGIFYNQCLIGSLSMHKWDHKLNRAELGYWLSKAYEGKGILRQCLVRFIDFLFDKCGITKIEIRFIPENTRSANVAGKLGFKVEGILRQSVIRNGMPHDVVVTGLLKNEWKKP